MVDSQNKPEFPPLLSPGFHRMALDQLRELCVAGFPDSLTRKGIMEGLERLVAKLDEDGIPGEIWVDGSFLTRNIEPHDVDLLLHISADVYDGDARKQAVVNWASDPTLVRTHSCDTNKWVEYLIGHPLFPDSEEDRMYWTGWYGTSRGGEPKGIAILTLRAAA